MDSHEPDLHTPPDGGGAGQHRDPLYHVTESFQQTFDAMGRRHAAQLAGGETEEHAGAQPGQPQEEAGQMPDPTSARGFYERSSPDDQDMLRRFSETAFQRGTLSGAVLQGTGQMMLFSCLKKTVGQSQPDKWQQRKLFEKASPARNVPGHSPDKVVFNRGFTDSAVGLVVDTLRGARRTVEDMRDLALGKSEMGEQGADTLRTMYPFLDDSRERALLEQYRGQLRDASSADEKAALQTAAARMEAMVAKKAQMRQEFANKLSCRAFPGRWIRPCGRRWGRRSPRPRTERGRRMEQQWSPERARQETEHREQTEQLRRQPERERISSAGQAARAVLAGAPLWELPPNRLEELAGWLGNQGMNALLEAGAPAPERARFLPPDGEVETVPFPVPEMPAETVEPPVELAVETAGRAFDPAGLTAEGGGPHGMGI